MVSCFLNRNMEREPGSLSDDIYPPIQL